MYNYNGNSTKPPVPPRRTKRKIKIAPIEPLVTNKAVTKTANNVVIPQQKRPPPPPLPEKCRRNNFGYLENDQPQCGTAANYPKSESEQHHRDSRGIDTASKMIESKPHDDNISTRDNSTTSNSANDDPIPQSIVSKPLSSYDVALSKQKAFDKYPSLFFTVHDFENVVSNTWNKSDSVDTENSQNLHEKKLSKTHILDDNDDVCFRVTTTNLPFERCLDRRKDPFDDDDFVRKFDYRFEDSTNENDRINGKRSSDYNAFDNNDESKDRISTKVRFMIESPNSSERNSNVKVGVSCDSSQSYESSLGSEQVGEQTVASSVKLTEIREKFADIKDCCDNSREKSYMSSVQKGNSILGKDDLFVPVDANKVDVKLKTIPRTYCDDRNNDVNYEKIHEESSDLTSWNVQISDEILKTGRGNVITLITEKNIKSEKDNAKQVDQSNISSEIADNVRFTDKNLEMACRIEEAKTTPRRKHKEEKMTLIKANDDIKEKSVNKNEKISSDKSSQNFLDECNDNESNKNISNDFINKSVEIEQNRRFPEENKERNNSSVDSKNKHEIVSSSEDTFVPNIPVEVRRNSFLETMLSDDLTDISMNCAVISASTNIDKELSDCNKYSNQIRELDTDITTENKCLYDFYNTTEMDVKNRKILKNSKKIEEKIIETSNVKLTQSENKSASEVKNDVLNELLCNFNNIKLKIVSPENKKSVTKIEDDENISSIASDNRISKEEKSAYTFEKSQNTKGIDTDNDIIVKEIVKKDFMKMKIEERSQDFKDTPVISSEKITKNKSTKIGNESSCDIKNKIVKNNSKIDKNSLDIKSEDMKSNSEKISEKKQSAVETNRECKKSRNIRIPKTILKKTSVECERQQVNEFQKRIPIGAPATMNKIFDSRELKGTRKNDLKNDRKCEKASREIHTRSKEKTDEVIVDDEADDDRRRIANRSVLALVKDTMSSGDKCAIARKTISVNPCNTNDNNRAVTPVVNVSNDQSFRDVVTITPGKVRSFVKYYEIRSDATTVERHSKINDREKVAKRKFTKSQAVPIAARNSPRPKIITKEMKGGDRSVKSNNCDPRTSFNKIQPSTFAPRVPDKSLNNPVYKTEMDSKTKEYEKGNSHMSDKQIRAPFIKTGTKKSVQFLGDFTVVHSETFGKDESTGTDTASRDTNMLRKKKAPGVPPRDCNNYQTLVYQITKSEKPPNVGKDSFRPQETVTQIHTVADHTQTSGINRFVSKSETPQLVFYCTI